MDELVGWLQLPTDVGAGTVVALLLAGLAAGWVDAVVGGGGLIQLPALLLGLGSGTPPVYALATNKIASICGTAGSSVTYYRRIRPDLRTTVPMAGFALAGALVGAGIALVLPAGAIRPVVLAALVGVLVHVVCRPRLGEVTALRYDGSSVTHHTTAGAIGFIVGVYDGAVGPGTGSFLVFGLVALLGYSFVDASARAKIANVATNLGALLVFAPQGVVLWRIGLLMGAANLLGGYLGARMAVARGARFVRAVFVVVSGLLVLRLGYDVLFSA
ncbi:MAG: sulfite exporter TauE/SafE family protein [Angustibacter sp.]